MNKFDPKFPYYDDDSDYNTNANSYYKDLGRKTKLIKLLAKRIWEYENTLNETLEQIEQRLTDYISQNDSLMNERLENWDKRIDDMPEEMRTLFVEWLNDGTLEQIINDDVLGNKADKTYVNELNENVTTQLAQNGINVKNFGATGDGVTDDRQAIQDAVDYVESLGGGILFFPKGRYRIETTAIKYGSNVRFLGVGRETIFDGVTGNLNNTFEPRDELRGRFNEGMSETYNGASNFSFENLAWDSSDRTRQMLYFDNCINFEVKNFYGLNTGDHYIDLNNSKNGHFENIYLNKNDESNSLFQIDSREGKNNNITVKNLNGYGEITAYEDYSTDFMRECLIHFHRTGASDIHIDGVYCENIATVVYKDIRNVLNNVTIENVTFNNGVVPLELENAGSVLQQNIQLKKWDIKSEKLYRGFGRIVDTNNLVIDQINVDVNEVEVDEPVSLPNARNAKLGVLNVIGELGDIEKFKTRPESVFYLSTSSSRTSQFTTPYSGTFKPNLYTHDGGETVTYSLQEGVYTVIGDRVFIDIRMSLNISGGSRTLYIDNLPFPSHNIDVRSVFLTSLTKGFNKTPVLTLNSSRLPNSYLRFEVFGEDTRLTRADIEDDIVLTISGNYPLNLPRS